MYNIIRVYANEFGVLYIHGTLERDFNLAVRQIFLNRPTKITAKYSLLVTHHLSNSVGRYHFFTSGIRYGKFRTVFGISRYLI